MTFCWTPDIKELFFTKIETKLYEILAENLVYSESFTLGSIIQED